MHPFIKIGHFTFQSYWVMISVGILLGFIILLLESKRKKINCLKIFTTFLIVLASSLLISRFLYLLFFAPRYIITEPVRILIFWRGGLTLHGGILGGIIGGLLSSKILGIKFGKIADIFAPAMAIGHAFGRIGCFLNGCCYGKETNMPWGVTYYNIYSIAPVGIKLHPTQLYESVGEFIIFIILWCMRKKINYDAGLFLWYIVLYSVLRIIEEPFRVGSYLLWGTKIPFPIVLSIIVIITSFLLMNKLKRSLINK